jgi:isochorismate pyruvate lyase
MDALDRELITLIAMRVEYVRAAAKFKSSPETVADPERMNKVYATRRAWAEEAGLDGDVIEGFYRGLVAYCVAEEQKHWAQISNKE